MMRRRQFVAVSATALATVSLWTLGCTFRSNRNPATENAATQPAEQPATATGSLANVILGRPTDSSIVLSVLCGSDLSAKVRYGKSAADLTSETTATALKAGQPTEIALSQLAPNTQYHYRVTPGDAGTALAEGTFHTQRATGATFTFTLTADPHLDENTDLALYQRTLSNAAADAPDFHIDLGDTFMTEKHKDRETATKQYLAQRGYFGAVCGSIPLFLTLGNHDGEQVKLMTGGSDSVAVWANKMRKLYFPNPLPDGFYSGRSKEDPLAGPLEDYYAWHWGDALLVVLNPYWQSMGLKNDPRWDITLGAEQYAWLKKTLESSRAKYKFVFVHQLVGGLDDQGRGGVEAVPFGEWGGKNPDGTEGFAEHRPGWGSPIHRLLVANHVTAVFHGHDHIFAKQDLDGIVYQEVPQPGFARADAPASAAAYGYLQGVMLGSSGHVRITVSPSAVKADYVRAYLPANENSQNKNGQIAYSYTMSAHA